jgi:hypothetical protein
MRAIADRRGAGSMEDKRKHPRVEINEPAYVSAGGSVMSCMVRNISSEGAAIEVANPAFVPPRFRLVMVKDSAVHECSVVWIQQNRIGLSFAAAPQEQQHPDTPIDTITSSAET